MNLGNIGSFGMVMHALHECSIFDQILVALCSERGRMNPQKELIMPILTFEENCGKNAHAPRGKHHGL